MVIKRYPNPFQRSSGQYARIDVYDTSDKVPVKICEKIPSLQVLNILHFGKFVKFITKKYINEKAYNEETVYNQNTMEPQTGILKCQYIADSIIEYLNMGIEIKYNSQLWSKRYFRSDNLNQFFTSLTTHLPGYPIDKLIQTLIITFINNSREGKKFDCYLKLLKDGSEIPLLSPRREAPLGLGKDASNHILSSIISSYLKVKGLEDAKFLDKVVNEVRQKIPASFPTEKLLASLPAWIDAAKLQVIRETLKNNLDDQ